MSPIMVLGDTMAKTHVVKSKENKGKDNSDSKLFALLGVALTIIGYIIVMLARKEDKYAVYYAKQGLILFIACMIAWVIGLVLGWIPILGPVIGWILNIILIALWIIGIVYSLSGEEKEIPVIGQFAKKI